MKAKKVVAVAVLFLLGFSTFASNNNNNKEVNIAKTQQVNYPEMSLGEYLNNNINYPELAKKKLIEGSIAAEINIDNNGQLCVTAINGHPLLTKSVKQQIESINCDCLGFALAPETIVKIKFEIE